MEYHVPMCVWCGRNEIQMIGDFSDDQGFCSEKCRDACHQAEAENDAQDEFESEREDNFRDDVEADADVLRMAGMGTDEDYGYFGEQDYECYDEGHDCE